MIISQNSKNNSAALILHPVESNRDEMVDKPETPFESKAIIPKDNQNKLENAVCHSTHSIHKPKSRGDDTMKSKRQLTITRHEETLTFTNPSEFYKFMIREEIEANCKLVKTKVISNISYWKFKVSHSYNYRIEERESIIYVHKIHNCKFPLQQIETKERESSYFYRKLAQIEMRDSNIKAISINRVIHEEINIDSAVSKNYHRISPYNLRRSLRRTRTNTLIFSENEFESLFIYTTKIIEENESLPIEKQSFILNIKGPDFETNPLDFFGPTQHHT